MLATTPQPPYYAVIFTSLRKEGDDEAYKLMAEQMSLLASQQAGYLGVESARENVGITVSYWDSLAAIKNWKNVAEHLVAQQFGREKWYSHYKTRICLVEREYGFEALIEKPSIQDLIITPIIGSIMGEIFYQWSQKIKQNNGQVLGSNRMGSVMLFILSPGVAISKKINQILGN